MRICGCVNPRRKRCACRGFSKIIAFIIIISLVLCLFMPFLAVGLVVAFVFGIGVLTLIFCS